MILQTETDPSWRISAACLGDPELFAPVSPEQERQAKAICASCPVIEFCLQHALDTQNYSRVFIYGGLNGAEREALVLSRQQVQSSSVAA